MTCDHLNSPGTAGFDAYLPNWNNGLITKAKYNKVFGGGGTMLADNAGWFGMRFEITL